jgi:enoyl-[acyl-carrier-protein] reductase (NADH)
LVSPGGIFDHQASEFLEAYKAHTLGRGMLDVGDVLGSILYLLSDYSQYVNGQNIVVDDGFTL